VAHSPPADWTVPLRTIVIATLQRSGSKGRAGVVEHRGRCGRRTELQERSTLHINVLDFAATTSILGNNKLRAYYQMTSAAGSSEWTLNGDNYTFSFDSRQVKDAKVQITVNVGATDMTVASLKLGGTAGAVTTTVSSSGGKLVFENFEFNTIISSLMELMNEMYKAREAGAAGSPEWKEAQDMYLRMVAPVAPHIAEELWTNHLGKPYSIHQQSWPQVDEAAAKEDSIELPVQINGKVRDRIVVPADASEEQIKAAALASGTVQKYLEGKEPKKVIVANKRLVSIVL